MKNFKDEEAKQIVVVGVKWDVDTKEDLDYLPTDITIEIPLREFNEFIECDDECGFEEYISDKISDISGFCHNGWKSHKVIA